ncbi:TraR/DksA family transcriptional regulator [Aliiroseovarius sp. YM-037]|uniref:TraR/DksA family transcriptional regulator n=1 Tax=Aliiroseovarius sp. YM-037 TaxID=3341728 RepID=UPI003A7FED6E
MQSELADETQRGTEGTKTVMLDQQSVGRLSRMDAIQNQAIAQAAQARREQLKSRIQSALARIEEDEFGYCVECGDEIAPKRLDLDPTTTICVTCAAGS